LGKTRHIERQFQEYASRRRSSCEKWVFASTLPPTHDPRAPRDSAIRSEAEKPRAEAKAARGSSNRSGPMAGCPVWPWACITGSNRAAPHSLRGRRALRLWQSKGHRPASHQAALFQYRKSSGRQHDRMCRRTSGAHPTGQHGQLDRGAKARRVLRIEAEGVHAGEEGLPSPSGSPVRRLQHGQSSQKSINFRRSAQNAYGIDATPSLWGRRRTVRYATIRLVTACLGADKDT